MSNLNMVSYMSLNVVKLLYLGYDRLKISLNTYLSSQGYNEVFLQSGRGRSPLMLFVTMAVVFSALTAILLFPSFQYASAYLDAITEESGVFKRFLSDPLIEFLQYMFLERFSI